MQVARNTKGIWCCSAYSVEERSGDVWVYLLAKQWEKIFEEQAFVGRCGYVGDEMGSRLIAAVQVQKLMRLCFLIEKKYAPYSKWFGTAFARLDCASELTPIFLNVLGAETWKTREAILAKAYKKIIGLFNKLKIVDPMSEEISNYFNRPFLVVRDESIVERLRSAIIDKRVLALSSD